MLTLIQSVFTPGPPVDAYTLFVGRTYFHQQVDQAVKQGLVAVGTYRQVQIGNIASEDGAVGPPLQSAGRHPPCACA